MAVELPENVVVSKLDELASWCRKNSLWPMPFATACCGIELMATGASRHDLARFGAEVFRFSPRQCDLMIVAGRVVMKMLPVLQRIWQQMHEPKWCISMGACASTGGVFDTYCVVQGIDRFIPVDMYVPGCPPRPEQLIQAIIDLQDKIQREGTVAGHEFNVEERQQPKRALMELPIVGQTPYFARPTTKARDNSPQKVCRCRPPLLQRSKRFMPDSMASRSTNFAGRRVSWYLKRPCSIASRRSKTTSALIYWSILPASTTSTTAARRIALAWSTNWPIPTTISASRLRIMLNEPNLTVPSGYALWEGADWLEREVYDLFGITFEGHPDLRRILMPDEFTAHPLRKDYPLQGRGERHNFPTLARRDA